MKLQEKRYDLGFHHKLPIPGIFHIMIEKIPESFRFYDIKYGSIGISQNVFHQLGYRRKISRMVSVSYTHLEAVIKPKWPEDFKRIIDITYRFSSGWRRVHNPMTGHDVADDLTTTEFAIAMLAARGWTTQEIAKHLNISVNTVKSHISEAMKKLNVETRKELKQYMLR